MNDRKMHVIKMAHHLFINKGFQATSIQDILEESGISKGTFYNYFPSKNELLIAIIKTLHANMEKERDELLIGQDPTDIDIFVKQVELQLKTNRANKLIYLFEEMYFSNDDELKQFIQKGHLKIIHWLYQRFIDLFGENKKAYFLDLAIMFKGILQQNLKYNALLNEANKSSIYEVVHYSVNRLVKLVDDLATTKEQLLSPALLENLFPEYHNKHAFQQEVAASILELKKNLHQTDQQEKYNELLDFIHQELVQAKVPRKFLIKSVILSLKSEEELFSKDELLKLEQFFAL